MSHVVSCASVEHVWSPAMRALPGPRPTTFFRFFGTAVGAARTATGDRTGVWPRCAVTTGTVGPVPGPRYR